MIRVKIRPVFGVSMLDSNAWSSGLSSWSGFTGVLERNPAETVDIVKTHVKQIQEAG